MVSTAAAFVGALGEYLLTNHSGVTDGINASSSRDDWDRQLAVLEDWQWDIIANYSREGQRCMVEFWRTPYPEGPHCNATWDNYQCWPTTPANTTQYLACPGEIQGYFINITEELAFRHCNASGKWQYPDWSNYNECLYHIFYSLHYNKSVNPDEVFEVQIATILVNIYFYGSIISCILLIITLFIFTYFKTLQCNRISIHKNLVVSFIVRSILNVIIYEPYISYREHSYRDIDWLCKLLMALQQYSTMANIFWMFVEGLFLHNRVAVSVFSTEAPFRIFYTVGWGLPGVLILIWATCMILENHNDCWNGHFSLNYKWIIVAPILIALVVNAIFLVNIIRILITKLRANNTMEADQVRKAVKATAVLFPLLGMTHLHFLAEPGGSARAQLAYRFSHAILQSSQGIFVSVIYCFMNSEVHTAIVKKWQRYKVQRLGNNRSRRRSSRTSSLFLSTTENYNHVHPKSPPVTISTQL